VAPQTWSGRWQDLKKRVGRTVTVTPATPASPGFTVTTPQYTPLRSPDGRSQINVQGPTATYGVIRQRSSGPAGSSSSTRIGAEASVGSVTHQTRYTPLPGLDLTIIWGGSLGAGASVKAYRSTDRQTGRSRRGGEISGGPGVFGWQLGVDRSELWKWANKPLFGPKGSDR